ncbi:MAG TPA: hypothetical protein VN864_06295 [Thermoplasmata archaeon]|nr:hypothetical protein [Thermoplasmata archaeon]
MTRPRHPACEWVGLSEDSGIVAICGRPALGAIAEASGTVHYACRDHLSAVKAMYHASGWTMRPAQAPARPYPEAIP